VHVAKMAEEFLRQLDEVVEGKRAPGRRDRLLGNASWDNRARELLAHHDGRWPAASGRFWRKASST
jgi:hypothetical protein